MRIPQLYHENFNARYFARLNIACKVLLVLLFLVVSPVQVNAYNEAYEVSGTVSDEDGFGLPGVNVIEKGTTNGTVTDNNGNYRLSVTDENATLIFSFIGYITEEIAVSSRSKLDITLIIDTQALEEVVVVGYGEQKKVTVTGAVAAVKGKALEASPAVDLSNSLSGRLPGLVVIQTSGEPGSDGASISIRGTNTLGDSSPLIVIDGIPDRDGGLGRLSSTDIESISVLKDASAAIYGARAANGAILVTTKRGSAEKVKFTYEFNQGWAQPTVVPNMSNAVEYANIMNELQIYQSIPVDEWESAWSSIQTNGSYTSPTAGVGTINATYSPDAIRQHGDGSDPWLYPDTDWFGDAFKNWAPQSRHGLYIQGGTEDAHFFASLGYVDQDAIYNNSATFYKQYNARINFDAKIGTYFKTQLGLMARREDRNYATQGAGGIFRMLMRGRPVEPEVWPTGEPGPDIENGQNPYVVTTNATGYDRQPTDFLQSTGRLDITNPWIEGLTLSLMGAVDFTSARRKLWETPWELYYLDKDEYQATGNIILDPAVRSNFTDPRLRQSSATVLSINQTALLTYDKQIGQDHNINILAGVTKETVQFEGLQAYRRNYLSTAVEQLFTGGLEGQETNGVGSNEARLGYYGRLQYNYKEKYLAEFIWRYDGSYIFPESDRFGFFPGLLLGWNISQEDFFNVGFIDYLKIRASYGQMGNDRVIDPVSGNLVEYAFLSTYGFGRYPINNAVQTTLTESTLANPNFTWERANNFNIGLDGTILNGRLDFTFEYFKNKRSNILLPAVGSTPASSGIGSRLPPENFGEVENAGFEFNTLYSTHISDVVISFGINGGYAKNNVVFMDETPGIPEYQKLEGKPIGAYLVYESDGAFLNEEEIAANTIDYSGVTSQLIPGDMKIRDYNGDGVINGDDQVRLDQNNTPTLNYGATFNMSWKNFDFSLLFQGAAGAAIRVQTESGDIGNFLKYDHDNRWSIDNPSSTSPRLASRGDTYYTGGGYGFNTYFMHSKDYIRLKNIQLAYNFPASITEKLGMENLRLYINGLNLFTITGNDIFDPEATAQNGVYYPQSRVINTGISVTF